MGPSRSLKSALVPLLAAGLLAACPGDGKGRASTPAPAPAAHSQDPTAEDYVSPELPRGRVVVKDAFGTPHPVDVEIATTHDSRTRGLMWRKELPAGKGMLFVFGEDEAHSFWMRNTLIPLDMLFIAADGKVVGLVQNAEPKTLTGRGPTDRFSRYVLEVPGGWTAKLGIQTGSTVEFHLPPDLDVER